MCGIAGAVGQLAARPDILEQMLSRIRHRGPDGCGTFSADGVALVHSRLSIIDLSDAAAQPMHDPVSGNVITYNGEIYNYGEVSRELGPGPPGMSDGDTATLLRAYGRFGTDVFSRLRGMFAFAIWDATRNKVLLARDRFGMKPLYYRRINGSLLFASEIRPLLLRDFPHSGNERVLAGFLAFRHLDTSDETCFKEIFQIPAAHYAWVAPDGSISRPVRYWSPPRFGSRPFDDAKRIVVGDAVRDSVFKHLRSDVPVGVFVSGGIDSSSIACTAAEFMEPGELSSFSSVLTGRHVNSENRLIPAVLEAIGSKPHNLAIDGSRFVDDLPRVFDCHEEPLADASMYAHWRLCEIARHAGIRVLLSGNGGDEVFGGYGSHVHACIGSLIRKGHLSRAAAATAGFHRAGMGTLLALAARGLHEASPLSVRQAIKQQHARRWLANSVFAPLASSLRFYYHSEHEPLTNAFYDNLEHWCVPPFLHYEDRNGMAFGVEIRTPMLDHELLERVWQFDPVSLLAGPSKHALRVAMRGTVPDEVLAQPGKFGFAAPLDFYLREDTDRFTDMYREVVTACPYFDTAAAISLLERFYAGGLSVLRPWRIFSVALWHDLFIRSPQQSVAPTASVSLQGQVH